MGQEIIQTIQGWVPGPSNLWSAQLLLGSKSTVSREPSISLGGENPAWPVGPEVELSLCC